LQNKAALLGVAQSDIVDVVRMGLGRRRRHAGAQHRFEVRNSGTV
jgi:hypothetical protein